jgi:hypothetical protein
MDLVVEAGGGERDIETDEAILKDAIGDLWRNLRIARGDPLTFPS